MKSSYAAGRASCPVSVRLAVTALILSVLWAAPAAQAVPIPGQGTWETVLQPRDFDLDGVIDGYYDTGLDITWAKNVNAVAGTPLDLGPSATDGITTAQNLQSYVSTLNLAGVTGWRLPTMVDKGTPGCNLSFNGTDCGYNSDTSKATGSELARMFYVTLGNVGEFTTGAARRPIGTFGLLNTGPFENIRSGAYATGLLDATGTRNWGFVTVLGLQNLLDNSTPSFLGWAVHDGDVADGSGVAPVSVPAAPTWCMILAGIGLAVVAYRKNQGQGPEFFTRLS